MCNKLNLKIKSVNKCGLKPRTCGDKSQSEGSLPMWERGLKLSTLRYVALMYVAPHVGAWIETVKLSSVNTDTMSLPMWERGLKHSLTSLQREKDSRSPCGSVD